MWFFLDCRKEDEDLAFLIRPWSTVGHRDAEPGSQWLTLCLCILHLENPSNICFTVRCSAGRELYQGTWGEEGEPSQRCSAVLTWVRIIGWNYGPNPTSVLPTQVTLTTLHPWPELFGNKGMVTVCSWYEDLTWKQITQQRADWPQAGAWRQEPSWMRVVVVLGREAPGGPGRGLTWCREELRTGFSSVINLWDPSALENCPFVCEEAGKCVPQFRLRFSSCVCTLPPTAPLMNTLLEFLVKWKRELCFSFPNQLGNYFNREVLKCLFWGNISQGCWQWGVAVLPHIPLWRRPWEVSWWRLPDVASGWPETHCTVVTGTEVPNSLLTRSQRAPRWEEEAGCKSLGCVESPAPPSGALGPATPRQGQKSF